MFGPGQTVPAEAAEHAASSSRSSSKGKPTGDVYDLLECMRQNIQDEMIILQRTLEETREASEREVAELRKDLEQVTQDCSKTQQVAAKLQKDLSDLKKHTLAHQASHTPKSVSAAEENFVLRSEVEEAVQFCRQEVQEEVQRSMISIQLHEDRMKVALESVVHMEKDVRILDMRLVVQAVSSSVFCLNSADMDMKERHACLRVLQKKERHLKRHLDKEPSMSHRTPLNSLELFEGTTSVSVDDRSPSQSPSLPPRETTEASDLVPPVASKVDPPLVPELETAEGNRELSAQLAASEDERRRLRAELLALHEERSAKEVPAAEVAPDAVIIEHL